MSFSGTPGSGAADILAEHAAMRVGAARLRYNRLPKHLVYLSFRENSLP